MNLGFIGTGKIASSVITGICTSKISFNKIIISPRNKSIAKNLKQKFKKVIIAKNNQQIVDKCDWVFLSVTPTVGDKIIKDLNEYKPDIINVILISLKNDISIPCFGEALNYFNSISSNSLSTKMIQAQRNFFGSHDIKIN